MIKEIFYLNEQGRRQNIEDSLYPLPGQAKKNDRVFLVCDGVGGESKGEEASRIVCEAMGKILNNSQQFGDDIVKQAALQAVEQLQAYAVEFAEAQNMSTTLTVACLQANTAWVAWCGDSRIYHVRNGKVLWRSKDHSLVQQLIEAGEITENEALKHPNKNIILRSLTAGSAKASIETYCINDLQENDYLFLCTDGILENVNDTELLKILHPDQKDKNKTTLFLQYCAGKTNDNFSMYLLQIGKDLKSTKKINHFSGKIFLFAAIVAGALLLGYFLGQKKAAPPKPEVQKIAPHTSNTDSVSDFAHSNSVSLPVITEPTDSSTNKNARNIKNSLTNKDSVAHKTEVKKNIQHGDSLQKNKK